MALYLCHDLHLAGLPGVDPEHEWSPSLLAFRAQLETAFIGALRSATGVSNGPRPGAVRRAVIQMLDDDHSPSLSAFMLERGTLDQMRRIVVHRSGYQLAEGDFHSFAIPRLAGEAKRNLVRIQAGEYGCDAPDREMHSVLFARAMRSLGLDDRRHAHLDVLPASALAVSNMISTFGLRRRWRGALAGQLAAFELTSVEPMRRYGSALRRLGAAPDACRFYDVHVLADAEHEQWGLDMIEGLARSAPDLTGDIMFGVASTIEVERRFALDLFECWGDDVSANSV
ncbi:MAG: iron-containing redox enzyme family protein [Acidimicrobiia bacterium]